MSVRIAEITGLTDPLNLAIFIWVNLLASYYGRYFLGLLSMNLLVPNSNDFLCLVFLLFLFIYPAEFVQILKPQIYPCFDAIPVAVRLCLLELHYTETIHPSFFKILNKVAIIFRLKFNNNTTIILHNMII